MSQPIQTIEMNPAALLNSLSPRDGYPEIPYTGGDLILDSLALRVLDAVPLAIYLADWEAKKITFSNREAIALWGLSEYLPNEIALKTVENKIHPEDRALYAEMLDPLCDFNGRPSRAVEIRVANRQGHWRWALLWCIPLRRMRLRNSLQILFCVQDITQRKTEEAQLKYRGYHDGLTDLYNRAYFEAELTRLAHSRSYPIGLMMIDVDNLKQTNDRLGHRAGDELLCSLASVLKEAFRNEDVIARLGGDEFAVVLPETDSETLAKAVVRVRQILNQHNAAHPQFPLQASIGTAHALSPADNLPDLFQQADKAMYRDKQRRKGLRR